jgi:predicted RND superfamily exporter protein
LLPVKIDFTSERTSKQELLTVGT